MAVIKCIRCGKEIEFTGDQWRKICGRCGNVIIASPEVKEKENEKKKNEPKPPACFICMDRGFVRFTVQDKGQVYELFARCKCEKGEKYGGWVKIDEADGAPDWRWISEYNRRQFMRKLQEKESDNACSTKSS